MPSEDESEAKRRAERIGALALLILIPGALVAFAIDGAVLLTREQSYKDQAAHHDAVMGAAAASVARATSERAPAPSASAAPAASAAASAEVKAGKP